MIPLRDSVPNVHKPWAVWSIMALNAALFLFTLTLSPVARTYFVKLFGFIPIRYTGHPGSWTDSLLWDTVPFFSYMFLHGGWIHFLMNMWVLFIFADNIEDVMGPYRFIVFYLLCGIAALAVHLLFNITSSVPIIGASGAIGGVLGAYFVLYPHARIETLIPIIIIPFFVELPATLFLGIWVLTQFFSGIAGQFTPDGGGIAFWAHTGGFVAGMMLIRFFRINERCYYCYNKTLKKYEREE